MSRKSTSSAAAEALAVTRPIQEDPDKLGGAPTIGAQRVHAETLIDYFAGGLTLEDFLEDFEGTPRTNALAVLSVVRQAIRDGLLTGMRARPECAYRGVEVEEQAG